MLQETITYIQNAAGGSEMITSAIALSLVGVVLSFSRNIPKMILNIIERQFTTTLTFNNGEYQSNETLSEYQKR